MKQIIAWLQDTPNDRIEILTIEGVKWLYLTVYNTPRWRFWGKHGMTYARHLSRHVTDYHWISDF